MRPCHAGELSASGRHTAGAREFLVSNLDRMGQARLRLRPRTMNLPHRSKQEDFVNPYSDKVTHLSIVMTHKTVINLNF